MVSGVLLQVSIRAIDLTSTVSQINRHLKISEYLRTSSTTQDKMVELESQHSMPHDFVLYHLWLDFEELLA